MSEPHFPHLFEPIEIGRMTLRNRIVMPPMSTNLGDPEYPGAVSKRHINYYGERAKGGAGMILVEATSINPKDASRTMGLAIYDDRFISGLHHLVEQVKSFGAMCGIQLNHGGRIGPMKVNADGSFNEPGLGGVSYAASALPHPRTGILTKELTEDQLDEITHYFRTAAARAKQAGFDCVEIHGGHGYLLNEFLSLYTNKRKDRFGGNLEGRARFPLQVVKSVKDILGTEVVLSYRISAVEFVEGGLDLTDVLTFAKWLEQQGVQILHVSAGINETPSAMNQVIPPMSFPRGRLMTYSERIKKEINIPIIVVQRITTPELAESIIQGGFADLVATGRALIADPYWPLKAREGSTEEIRRCIGCNQGCIERIVLEKPLTCIHNPEVGYENVFRFGNEKKKKRILVVGGGLAGLEASYILAKRGHEVRLMEKEDLLGGAARVASIIDEKREFSGILDYLENQLKKMNIDIRLNEPMTPQHLKEGDFDHFIIATGSLPIVPKINLSKKDVIRFAKEVLRSPEGIGERIIILGGGSVGVEVAEHLHRLKKNVTLIEMLDKICADLGPLNRVNVEERVKHSSIKIMLNTRVLEINDEEILVLRYGKEETIQLPDCVVIAMGERPNPLSVKNMNLPIHYLGNCQKVGNALDAIHEAFKLAISL